MNADARRTLGLRMLGLGTLAVFAALVFTSFPTWALPIEGSPAPLLEFTELLQAPAGTRAEWGALRGKAVVLEFWATWCAPCVAEIPHWNKLAASVDPAKFQFISIDDKEDAKVVRDFLGRRKMAGWAGIDTKGRTFTRYAVKFMPTTVIVDATGRIVAVTNPQDVEADDLLAVASGKRVKFKPAVGGSVVSVPAVSPIRTKPLYEISLTRSASSKAPAASMSAGPGRMDMYEWRAEQLLAMAYSVSQDRIVPVSPLPNGLYNLHAVWSSGDDNDLLMKSDLRSAISLGLNLRVESKTVTKSVFVLRATEMNKKLLTPTAMTSEGSLRTYSNGKVQLINGSMDDLASALEAALGVPVVNETGIQGKFDETLEFPAKAAAAAKSALMKTLGLELVKEDKPIEILKVDSRGDAAKVAKTQNH